MSLHWTQEYRQQVIQTAEREIDLLREMGENMHRVGFVSIAEQGVKTYQRIEQLATYIDSGLMQQDDLPAVRNLSDKFVTVASGIFFGEQGRLVA